MTSATPLARVKAAASRVAKVPIPLLCYGLVWALWLCACVGGLARDSLAKGNGSLQSFTLSLGDFEQVDFEPVGPDALRSTSHDPQLIWHNTAGRLRGFRFAATASDEGHEMCLYYTNPGDKDFSEDKRVWPVLQPDGSYLFTLPRTEIERLRLDPVSVKNITVEFGGFWLNEPQSALQYFNPGGWGLVSLLIGPALLAAALRWLADTSRHYAALLAARKEGR